MTLRGRLISLFPAYHILSAGAALLALIFTRDWLFLPVLIFAVYIQPVLLFRLHNVFCPLKEGRSDLSKKQYNSWWASYQFQLLFMSFPFLEAILHFFPGLFSFWLRCWGSKIGKGVNWNPRVEITDRSLVEVGDYSAFGHSVILISHVVNKGKSCNYLLYVKKVNIGSGALIGAGTQAGPGVCIESGAKVPVSQQLYINQKVAA